MSEWTKIEQPADVSAPEPAPEPTPKPEPEPAVEPVIEPAKKSRSAKTRPAIKTGRHKGAAPLGFVILTLALIGVIAVAVSGVRWARRAADDTPLKEEIASFLEPALLQNPTAFTGDAEAAKNPSCVKAALWKISDDERIRMRREKADCRFPADEQGRLLIPADEVNEAFHALFGGDALPDETLFLNGDDFSIWYDGENARYHLPAFAASPYRAVIDTLKKQDGGWRVRVGFVAQADIAVDDKGNDVPPTAADASVFQIWTVRKTADGYLLLSVEDDAGQ
ncbi:MAG: hypothetical protein ACOYJY_00390 [Acutalibacteraceae bacterium]|jgi:hypothetical protein